MWSAEGLISLYVINREIAMCLKDFQVLSEEAMILLQTVSGASKGPNSCAEASSVFYSFMNTLVRRQKGLQEDVRSFSVLLRPDKQT